MAAALLLMVLTLQFSPAPAPAAPVQGTGVPAGNAQSGYRLVASDGGVFSFGAPFFGSMGGVVLNRPVVGMVSTPSGLGYYLVASDGGIFTFGDAQFQGSTGGQRLNSPIVGMALDPATGGYWLVASDGGVFSFGAPFFGSMGGVVLNRPVVGMVSTPSGLGYYLVASDGGIFTFGDAQFQGSTGAQRLNSPIVGMAVPESPGGCPDRSQQVPGDPYSPPCTEFGGPNGGSTSRGVTSSTITVSYRITSTGAFGQAFAQLAGAAVPDTSADTERTVLALAQYINSHYQMYGRQLYVNFYNGQGSLTGELQGGGNAAAQADAATVSRAIGAFADLSAQSQEYADALVQQGVVALGDPSLPPAWHEQSAPYAWSIYGDNTVAAAYYALAKLCPAGSPATYAGGALKGSARKLAIVAPTNEAYQASVSVFNGIVDQSCAAQPLYYSLDLGTESGQASNLVAQLKAGGYTTVFCACDPVFLVYMSGQAAQQGYLPEVLTSGDALTDSDYVGQIWNQQFAAHVIGVSSSGPSVPPSQTPGYAAYKTVRSDEPAAFVNAIYRQMQMLAIGIQMAGPNLTPSSFEQGMFNYGPHPGPDGTWSFGPAQFTAPADAREVCWSPGTNSAANGKPGAFTSPSAERFTSTIPADLPSCPIPP